MRWRAPILAGMVALGLLACAAIPAWAQMDPHFTYQGQLKDRGDLVTDVVDLRFTLWDSLAGGHQIGAAFTPAGGVNVVEGLFAAQIDSTTFGVNGFNGDPRWLQIEIYDAGWVALTPRHPITPAPYALYAAESGGGTCLWSENGGNIYYNSGNVGVGTTTPSYPLQVSTAASRAVYAQNTTTTGVTYGLYARSTSTGGRGVYAEATAESGTTYGLEAYAASPNGFALYGFNEAGTGEANAVRGECGSPNGIAIYGHSSNDSGTGMTIGIKGEINNPTGSAIYGKATATTGTANGVFAETASTNGSGVFGQNTATTGENEGVMGVSGSTIGRGVYGYNGNSASTAIGVCGRTMNGKGVFGEATSVNSPTAFGVYGRTLSPSGAGVYGEAPADGRGVVGYAGADNYGYLGYSIGGVYGRSTDGYGVRGYSVNDWGVYGSVPFGSTQAGVVGGIINHTGGMLWKSNSGVSGSCEDGQGVAGRTYSGTGVWGEQVNSGNIGYLASSNEGAYGEHDATGNFGRLGSAEAGVYGESDTYGDNGVRGVHTLASNDTPGVYGEHAVTDYYGIGVEGVGGFRGVLGRVSPTGNHNYIGVRGEVLGGAGINYGVFGSAGDGNYNYGVYGSASGGTANYAGYFNGNVGVSGILSKGGGTFKIDHPLDPENKYLYHSFVESPDMMNIYNGNVLLDDAGEATVVMPEWFEALNMEFRYQLTCIGGFAQVYVAEEIADNKFKIAGGKPGLKVSWQVTGVRHDPFANAHRVQVEVDKSDDEIGTYLHPEEWGVSSDLQVDRMREARRADEVQDIEID